MKPFIFIPALLCALSACNAMEGLGKDIQNMGSALEQKALSARQSSPPRENHASHPNAYNYRSTKAKTSTPDVQLHQAPAAPVDPVKKEEVDGIIPVN